MKSQGKKTLIFQKHKLYVNLKTKQHITKKGKYLCNKRTHEQINNALKQKAIN